MSLLESLKGAFVQILATYIPILELNANRSMKTRRKSTRLALISGVPVTIFLMERVSIRAKKAVIGLQKAKAKCRYLGTKFNLGYSNVIFKLDLDVQPSLDTFHIWVPTSTNALMMLIVDVVQHNISYLAGLDATDFFKLCVKTEDDKFVCIDGGYAVPVCKKWVMFFFLRMDTCR